jgi:hypothetical protein
MAPCHIATASFFLKKKPALLPGSMKQSSFVR